MLNVLLYFALAVLVYTLFPRQVQSAGRAMEKQIGSVLLWGAGAALLALPLMLLLLITIVGTPLLILGLAAAWILGYTALTLLLGGRVWQALSPSQSVSLGKIAIGVALLGLAGFIPFIGHLIRLAVFVVAIGASLSTRFGTLPHEM